MKLSVSFADYSKFPPNYWKWLAIIGWILFFLVLYCWLWFPNLEAHLIDYSVCSSDNPACQETKNDVEGINIPPLEPDWDKLVPIIIQIESSGNPNTVSKAGCRGIAQFSKIAWDEVMDVSYIPNVYNPKLSKIACKRYLLLLKKRLGKNYTLERLLASYNMGLSRLKKLNYEWWRIKETKKYVQKIKTNYYQMFRMQ